MQEEKKKKEIKKMKKKKSFSKIEIIGKHQFLELEIQQFKRRYLDSKSFLLAVFLDSDYIMY